MTCIFCGKLKTSTVNSRKSSESCRVWRRHLCEKCGRHFTSYETPHLDAFIELIDNDKSAVQFSTSELRQKLDEAFSVVEDHSPSHVRAHSEHILDSVLPRIASRSKESEKDRIYQISRKEVDSIVLDTLFDYNEKAYYRYLSST